MTQYTKADNGYATRMMWDAGCGGGGPFVVCSCGTQHSMTDQEFEESGCNGFDYIELDGQQFVYECPGCEKKLLKYENFIWRNRDHIRRYLKIRVDQEKAWADQQKMLNVIAGIDSPVDQ
jgi:hypothetical protein